MNDVVRKEQGSAPPALFVYIPYCATICTYCDFNVYARREGEFDAYADAVLREIELTVGQGDVPRRAKTLAFGGGTPSILSAGQMEKIVNKIREHFDFESGAEWTLEANPGTVDLDKLRALRQMGFTRLSLGVQTFDNARLEQFNRHHSVAESYEAFELARRAGFENINLDLIYGLSEQSLENWRETLDKALAFQSEHLSLYGLQVEDRTVLKKQIALGRIAQPDPDVAADMYELAVEMLGRAGFEHYEISNFARRGFESQHNKTYWLNEPYLGFGAGAHSSQGGERYENVRASRSYISLLRDGDAGKQVDRETSKARERKWVSGREVIPREMAMAETIFLGLRLAEGVGWERFRERFGVDAREVYQQPIALLAGWGMLQVNDERMRLTEQGMLVSNQILWRFLPDESK